MVWLFCLLCAASISGIDVTVPNGTLRGYVDINGVATYLGVPFAEPPLHDLRWKPPQSYSKKWTGTRDATEFGKGCFPGGDGLINITGPASEDCLFLNIYTPHTTGDAPLPVMVWVFGGGFNEGNTMVYNASILAKRGKVIVVTTNYRVGALGFLGHKLLFDENPSMPTTGNYGIQDQVFAMRWVVENIHAFGGNPEEVTWFGQSAGGSSQCIHAVSPQTADLVGKNKPVKRLILQSATCSGEYYGETLEFSEKIGVELQNILGCKEAKDVLKCMRDRPALEIVLLSATLGATPTIDGYQMTHMPLKSMQAGQMHDAIIMSGSTLMEANIATVASMDVVNLTAIEYELIARGIGPKVLEHYKLSDYRPKWGDRAPDMALGDILTDIIFTCPTQWTHMAYHLHRKDSYYYIWGHQPDCFPHSFESLPWVREWMWKYLGPCHATEIPYVYGGTPNFKLPCTMNPAVVDFMLPFWANFATTSAPGSYGNFTFPKFNNKTMLGAHLDIPPRPQEQYRTTKCDFWKTHKPPPRKMIRTLVETVVPRLAGKLIPGPWW